jgi:polysaccharide biosynthesis/export protein
MLQLVCSSRIVCISAAKPLMYNEPNRTTAGTLSASPARARLQCMKQIPLGILSIFLVASCFSPAQTPPELGRALEQGGTPAAPRITNQVEDRRQLNDRVLDYDRMRADRVPNEDLILKPEGPNEFQRYIQSVTGQQLPLFGSDLFRRVPSTFAPVDRIAVTSNYIIGPGDDLLVRGWGSIIVDYRATVDRNGTIFIPQVGEISVAGLMFKDLQPYLKAQVGRVFKNFDLSVTVAQLRSVQVFVLGHARRPGAYTVSALSTIVNAVFASGGASSSGSLRNIQLRRGEKVISEFDFYALLVNGNKSQDTVLQAGDVLFIPPISKVAAVFGSVNTPAVFELREGTTLQNLIGYAGGVTPVADARQVTIERITGTGRQVIEADLESSGSTKIESGDLVTVRSLTAKLESGVSLRGNVANPGRFAWRPGMRIRDLIPTRDALVTKEFWRKQTALVQLDVENNVQSTPEVDWNAMYPGLVVEAAKPSDPSTPDPKAKPAQRIDTVGLEQDVKQSAPAINWDYAAIQRFNIADLSTSLIPFNIGRAISDPADENNLALQPGDVITVFSQTDIRVPIAKRAKFVRLEGEFNTAGVYQVLPGETLRDLVARIGGVTANAYIFGSEFTRESVRQTQQQRLNEFLDRFEQDIERGAAAGARNVLAPEEAAGLQVQAQSQRNLLAKLRQIRAEGRIVLGLKPADNNLDNLPDLVLEDGDRFFVPYRPATVNVLGAVYNQNAYVYHRDRQSNDYIRRAGGGTRTADRRHAFVVRADGSVVSKSGAGSWFGSGLDSVRLMPGDTIVIPEQLSRTAFIKGLRDWTQILYQFTLGAAALRTLTD